MSDRSNPFDDYLRRHIIEKGKEYSHTRIGDKAKISGGSYYIENEIDFLNIYYDNTFVKGISEYLTEKQYIDDAPLVVDVDMRYSTEIKSRQHTKEHIIDLIDIYAKNIGKICKIDDNMKIEVFVMEKPGVNILDTKTKDGIHIIFGISMHRGAHILLREKVLPELKEIWEDLPLTNDIDELIDEGITKGSVNWQLYGSRKPNHSAYLIKYHFELCWNINKDEWILDEWDIDKFDTKKNLHKLSVHCRKFPKGVYKESYKEEVEKLKEDIGRKKRPMKLVVKDTTINTTEKLDNRVAEMLALFEQTPMDYELKETHEFAMILPQKYWGPGSYNKWIRVGWALKNTSTRLLPTWLKFCSYSKEFNFTDVPGLIEEWNKFDYDNPEGLTARSIMYWAKIDNPVEYKKVREETISYYMELTITHATEWDFAQVLYQMCKDEFICVSIKNNVWYEYRKHRWYEIDSGNTLRLMISKRMHDMYQKRVIDAMNKLQKMDQTDDGYEILRKRVNKLTDLCPIFKKTTWKNNIMREAKELFYDKDFINKLDNNPNLLCFNNYIIDFKNKQHRTGQPDDYISKCTNIDYIPLDKFRENSMDIINEINQFIEQLFPNKELRKYMWEHLASVLIGNNDNQTFNIYTGSGRNGKSKLVDLMSKVLGDYKATVPITLVTQKEIILEYIIRNCTINGCTICGDARAK